MKKKYMEEAIEQGRRLFQEHPSRLGSENTFIKIEVAAWLWEEFKKTEDILDPEMRILEFLARVTK